MIPKRSPVRRSASANDVSSGDLQNALKRGTNAAMLKMSNEGDGLYPYPSMDMKRGLDHNQLVVYKPVLERLLSLKPSGIFLQNQMSEALRMFASLMSLKQVDPELEGYRLRVMLAHVRLLKVRNLPKGLSEKVREGCQHLMSCMDVDELQSSPKAPKQCLFVLAEHWMCIFESLLDHFLVHC